MDTCLCYMPVFRRNRKILSVHKSWRNKSNKLKKNVFFIDGSFFLRFFCPITFLICMLDKKILRRNKVNKKDSFAD